MLAEIFDLETRGKANGVFNWGVYFGIGLTFTLGNYIAPANILTEQGWRSAFVIGKGSILGRNHPKMVSQNSLVPNCSRQLKGTLNSLLGITAKI